LVVISHDRHLLRSVCDELMNVHDGTVDYFNQSLDEYPTWLKEQQAGPAPDPESGRRTTASSNKKHQRQQEARKRQQLKPLSDRVRNIESRLEASRKSLEQLEQLLADTALYSDPSRKEELGSIIREQGTLKSNIDTLEWEWLEASEALEQATPSS